MRVDADGRNDGNETPTNQLQHASYSLRLYLYLCIGYTIA